MEKQNHIYNQKVCIKNRASYIGSPISIYERVLFIWSQSGRNSHNSKFETLVKSTFYLSKLFIVGNSKTSRIAGLSVSSITRRSMP